MSYRHDEGSLRGAHSGAHTTASAVKRADLDLEVAVLNVLALQGGEAGDVLALACEGRGTQGKGICEDASEMKRMNNHATPMC